MGKNTDLVRTSHEILKSGAKSLDQMADEFQALALVLDISGSMSSSVSCDDEDTKPKYVLQAEVVKEYLRSKLEGKLSTMKVSVLGFNSSTRSVVRDSSDLAELERGLDTLYPSGSTHLAPAIAQAMSLVIKNLDYIPRIVVTSDGAVHDPDTCMEQARAAKQYGVLIDTIFIGHEGYDDGAAFLKRLSDETGGVAERVNSTAEFKQKFLKVLERKLITAGKPELKA